MTESENRSILHSYSRPPAALLLVVTVGLPLLTGFTMTGRRGWPLGVLSGAIFAVIMVAGLLPSYRPWARRHSLVDGGALGPITFVFVLYVTPLPVWASVIVGVAGTGVGVLAGLRRRSRWQRQADEQST